MKEKISKFFKKKLGRRFVILVSLLILWLVLTISYLLTFDISFSNLSYNHGISNFNKVTFNKLNKGNKVSGEFTARDNNLGIVAIRFQTYVRPPYKYEDDFLFKIKEKGARNWYYVNTYRSGLIYDVPLFPFGFPQIMNSKGKEYEFEIISLNGNDVNAISIKNQYPILETKYKYSGNDLIHNKIKLLRFSIQKTYNAFQIPDVWFSSFIYLLPFIFYLFWITSFGNRLLKPFYDKLSAVFAEFENIPLVHSIFSLLRLVFLSNFDIVIIVVILIDIFIMQLNNDVIYFVIIPLWIITLEKYGLSSRHSFIVGLSLLLLPPLFLFFKIEPTAEKAAVWAYLLIIAGTIQVLMELKSSKSYEKN